MNVNITNCLLFIPVQDAVYWMTTAHPLIKLPIFLMGMLGGLQVLRANNHKDSFVDPNLDKNLVHTLLPWGCNSRKCCCGTQKMEAPKKVETLSQTKIWRRRVDFNAFLFVGFLCALSATKLALDICYTEGI